VAAGLVSRLVLALAFALAAVAIVSSAAHASLVGLDNNCGATSQPFAQFGDSRFYTFGANGGLESGATGWTLAGARVTAGNESYYSHASSDRYSLALPTGSTATTPRMCMGTTSTYLRFFLKRDTTAGSLRVQVVLRNVLGSVVGVIDWTTVSGSTTWSPGPLVLNADSLLGLLGVSSIQLKFTAQGGGFHVDDVWVDPWSSRD
jgi:hypothetical protein